MNSQRATTPFRSNRLSSYLSANEKKWRDSETANIQRLMSYLEKRIDVDLSRIAKTKDEVAIFRSLEGWLLNYYPTEFLDGLAYIDHDHQEYQKKLIYSFILSITRNKPNVNMLCDLLTSRKIITEMFIDKQHGYEIKTENFGDITFQKADEFIDQETQKYLATLGEQVVDGCHEIAFFLIKKNPNLKAVTSICTKGLGCNYYHSFVLDADGNVIDLTANLIMPKDQYYLLHNVRELNTVNYEESLSETQESLRHDESKTLYDLLRNALYKQFQTERKQS